MSHATIVAQTPFQLFGALLIANYSPLPCDLWLIDPTLAAYQEACRELGIWRNVYYAEKNGGGLWLNDLSSKKKRILTYYKSRRSIVRYLSTSKPQTIFIFSDNHELTALFAEYRRFDAKANVVLVEEGVTVFFPPDRVRAPYWKALCRHVLRISNPWGFSIGWSPHVNKLLLSDPQKTHPKYVNGRPTAKWPDGPYPDASIDDFIRLVGGTSELPDRDDVDIVYLGTPMSEEGVITRPEEEQLVNSLVNHGLTWIKPHPFDSPDKYDFCKCAKVFSKKFNNVPAEILFHILQPRVVISNFSSAAFNYCVRYGKGAIFFIPPNAQAEFKTIIEQHFIHVPSLRLVHDLSLIPAAIAELLEKDVTATVPPQASAEMWQETVAWTLDSEKR